MEIVTKIRHERQKKGYSQEYMAGQMGICTKTYRNIENGVSKIDIKRLADITEILEIELFDLINTKQQNTIYNYNGNTCEIPVQKYQSNHKVNELYGMLLKEKDARIGLLEARLIRVLADQDK